MTTVLRFDKLKFKVNKKDHNPPHVHVEGGGASVRISLLTFEMMDDHTDFSPRMVGRIIAMVVEHRDELMAKWEEYHG